jgi:rubrerythrin
MTYTPQVNQIVSDLEYDWLTVMQNKAEAMNAYEKYIKDAEEANSQECIELFRKLKQAEAEHIQEVRKHLLKVMQKD